MNAEFEALLAKTKSILTGINIPAQLTIIKELMAEQRKPDPDMQRISDIIGSDVRISAATLKQANSPIFGARGTIGSIQQAVFQLGYRNVFCVVMSLSLQAASSSIQGKFIKQFWLNSNMLASVCYFLGRKLRVVKPDEAYVAGLFLNCGVPLLYQRFSDYEELYVNTLQEGERNIADVEREKYETDHGVVGYVVCQSWDLPDSMIQTVLRHHQVHAETFSDADEDKDTLLMLAVVKLAEHIVNMRNGLPDAAEWEGIMEQVYERLSVKEADVEDIIENLDDLLGVSSEDD